MGCFLRHPWIFCTQTLLPRHCTTPESWRTCTYSPDDFWARHSSRISPCNHNSHISFWPSCMDITISSTSSMISPHWMLSCIRTWCSWRTTRFLLLAYRSLVTYWSLLFYFAQGDMEDLGLTFTVSDATLGRNSSIDLIANGSNIAVNSSNRYQQPTYSFPMCCCFMSSINQVSVHSTGG